MPAPHQPRSPDANALRDRTVVRVIACGGEDDGTALLLDRMIRDGTPLNAGELAALDANSPRYGARAGDIDDALAFDALATENLQRATIEAVRGVEFGRRRYIVADASGPAHDTRDLVARGSTSDVAVIVVDARRGALPQTRLHMCIVSMLGVRHIVVAVDRMDLVSYSEAVFTSIVSDRRQCGLVAGVGDVVCIPVSSRAGDNVVERSGRTGWYEGPTLVGHLESVVVGSDGSSRPFRMVVQRGVRQAQRVTRCTGTIVSGVVRTGETIEVLPSGDRACVERIVTAAGDVPQAVADQSVTLALGEAPDVIRGDVLCTAGDPVSVADQFEASLVWMDAAPMLRGRRYLMKIAARQVEATVAPLKYRVNTESMEHVAADTLLRDQIGICVLKLDIPIAFEPYAVNRDLGGFILFDQANRAVGAGQLRFALRRSQNIRWQAFDIGRDARAALKAQTPCVLWLTGLSGAGKSTIANAVEKKLHALGRHTYLLDGDNVRKGLNKDLGFTDADRVENIRRVAEVAALMADAGLIVLTAFISPFRDERSMARALMPEGAFLEIFVDTPLEVAEQRDVKGLYRKARSGKLANFTGVDSPYERPEGPDLTIDGATLDPGQAAQRIVDLLRARRLIAG